jgi:O-antigen/teichoic acid export membrane protein
MDSRTKRRLLLNFVANWIGRLANTIILFVQVPVFLHYWSVPLYGDWLIVNTVPTYLSFSNIGFGTVAGNEMTMLVARGDRDGALRIFQSCWWLIAIICTATVAVLSGALYFLPATRLLKLHNISNTDAKWIIFYLGLAVLLGQLEQLLQSAYRCVGRNPYGSMLKSACTLAAFAIMLVPVILGRGPRATALVFAVVNITVTIFFCVLVKHDIPWIEYGWTHASLAEIRKLLRPAIAFMGFPIGNALNLQGTLLAVGYALGPTAVVVFSTARTVSRVALQMVQMVNSTFEPEITMAFGASNIGLTRSLHRRAVQFALIIAVVIVVCMMLFGPWFLSHWTSGHVPPSKGLLAILLVVVIFYTLWSTSSTLMTATNQHQRLAAYYIVATTITCGLCYLLARWYGLYGAAISLLVAEGIMNLYVLPACLVIAHDTLPAFLASMLNFPSSLRPAALLARLKKPRPQLETQPEDFI